MQNHEVSCLNLDLRSLISLPRHQHSNMHALYLRCVPCMGACRCPLQKYQSPNNIVCSCWLLSIGRRFILLFLEYAQKWFTEQRGGEVGRGGPRSALLQPDRDVDNGSPFMHRSQVVQWLWRIYRQVRHATKKDGTSPFDFPVAVMINWGWVFGCR